MFYIVIVFIIFLLDQITKYFAVMNLKFVNSKVIIKNFLEMKKNKYIIYSLIV